MPCQLLFISIALLFSPLASADDAPLPAEVDLRPEFEIFDLPACSQGSRNTCSLFAITALAEFEAARSTGEAAAFSQEFLTWSANDATGRAGDQAMFYEALAGLNEFGICAEELMPYERREDRSREPAPEVIEVAGQLSNRWRVHWIKLWDVEQPMTAEQMHSIKAALADGHPVACGLRWPNDDTEESLLNVPGPDDVFDGHSIAFVGYRDDATIEGGGEFIYRNSNGPRWGDEGYGVMSYAYVEAYANDAPWIELGPADCERPLQRIEAETLTVTDQQDCSAGSQSMRQFGGEMWSDQRQLFCQSEQGGCVELAFAVNETGTYNVRLLATAAPDYGQIAVSLDGMSIEATFDLYSGRVCPAGSVDLGTIELAAGEHRLRIESVGKTDASTGYSFGIDTLDLLPAE